MRSRSSIAALATFTVLLVGVVIALSEDALRQTLWSIYFSQFVLVVVLGLRQRDQSLFFMSPSFLLFAYIAVNNVLGSLAFYKGVVAVKADLHAYENWSYLSTSVVFILLANLCVMVPQFATQGVKRPPLNTLNSCGFQKAEMFYTAAFCAAVLFVFSLFSLNLEALGGMGNFSIFPKTIAVIGLFIVLAKHKPRGRFLFYLIVFVYFASFSSDNKREALSLLLPLLLLENLRMHRFSINWKILLGLIGTFSVATVLILIMSIQRGYGEFGAQNFVSAASHLGDYVSDPDFWLYFGNNTEVNYIFYHLHQAIQYVIEDPSLMLWGSTFLKVFTVPVPRSLYPDKPLGILEIYTSYHSPAFRDIGGSWVSTMYSEFFWNFHFLGLVALLLASYLMAKVYLHLGASIRRRVSYDDLFLLYSYQAMFELIRGSGLAQFTAHLLVAWLLVYCFFFPIFKIIGALSAAKRGDGKIRNPLYYASLVS